LQVLSILDGIYRSQREGREIAIPATFGAEKREG
jgi:hypothetical protein